MAAPDRVDRLGSEIGTVNQRLFRGSILAGAQALFAIGIILGIIAFAGSSYADDSRDQRDFQILAMLGLGLGIGGAALYLRHSLTEFPRHWLARVVDEQEHADDAGPAHQSSDG